MKQHNTTNKTILLIVILAMGMFLRFYKLAELMPFIGDQGWFYLSARDMLITGHIPLVGITSSHTWLHQGPLYTYVLAAIFFLTHFHPLTPGYFFAGLDTITIYVVYRFTKSFFSEKDALFTSFLYAISPLIVLNSRMPYHTSLIPLVCLLFLFSMIKWVKGNTNVFPLIIFSLAILYNLELATAAMWLIPLVFFLFGLYTKATWCKLGKKTILQSILAWVVPMIPMIAYDTTHGYPQTVRFFAWIVYRGLTVVGFPQIHQVAHAQAVPFFFFTLFQFQQLFFLPNGYIGLLIMLVICLVGGFEVVSSFKRKIVSAASVVSITFFISLFSYLAAQTTSGAYFPMLFLPIILLCSISIKKLQQRKVLYVFAIVLLIIFSMINADLLLRNHYYMSEGFGKKLVIAEKIIHDAKGKAYTIVGGGPQSQFSSFTMNYQYITWWLGHPETTTHATIRFVIKEANGHIYLSQQSV